MKKYYLAVDIGASSGRHMLGTVEKGRIVLEEVYRFSNEMKEVDGVLCWDTEYLFQEILAGMKQCSILGKIPACMGIDTWAVDFVLLEQEGNRMGAAAAYRDSRTEGMDQIVDGIISQDKLYERTGIQKQIFNTIYQLMAVKKADSEGLERAESLLMIPDYFHYLLTGVKLQEYTNATTTQLVSPETNTWDYELIARLGFPEKLFGTLSMPGSTVGRLTEEIQDQVGYDCQVILPATHDTASAVAAVPTNNKEMLYISSGTWSLMGTERLRADCSKESQASNLTNEGGCDYRFRYLKNIMGLWMIQSVKREIKDEALQEYSFARFCEMASSESIESIVDCNCPMFLAPDSMVEAVQQYCEESGQAVPHTSGELAAVIYNSLAVCYEKTVHEIEARTGVCYDGIHIIGGGANAGYLNHLTAQRTKKRVLAGPSEATAIGNLLVQMIAAGEFISLQEGRSCVRNSFPIKEYKPEGGWNG